MNYEQACQIQDEIVALKKYWSPFEICIIILASNMLLCFVANEYFLQQSDKNSSSLHKLQSIADIIGEKIDREYSTSRIGEVFGQIIEIIKRQQNIKNNSNALVFNILYGTNADSDLILQFCESYKDCRIIRCCSQAKVNCGASNEIPELSKTINKILQSCKYRSEVVFLLDIDQCRMIESIHYLMGFLDRVTWGDNDGAEHANTRNKHIIISFIHADRPSADYNENSQHNSQLESLEILQRKLIMNGKFTEDQIMPLYSRLANSYFLQIG
ncbi:MAG: hypothetical protein MHMPM18_004080 [Marteilia pararefringens]